MTTRLVATGDSILTRRLSAIRTPGFTEVVERVRAADVSFTNLEMVFPGAGRMPSTTFHGTHVGVDPALLDEFGWFGFDLYGMANNHATDYGTNGLAASIAELNKRGMVFAGVGHTLREALRPVYFQTARGRVALISAGSSNARLSIAADPGEGDIGRPGMAPVRLQKTHYIAQEKFELLRDILAEAGVNVAATGTTAPGISFPYPDMNVYDRPPADGFAVEGVHFAPDARSHIHTGALERDVDALVDVVAEAKKQADLVFVALHCHEGVDGRWNTEVGAEFLRPLAHKLIDAGANAILGSGPHMLRGMELYRNRPICYSLGNFIFTLETMDSFPVEVYEQQGMPLNSTAADLYDRVTGYATERRFWESVVAEFAFDDDGDLAGCELVPVTSGFGAPRSQRGCPVQADENDSLRILEHLDGLSRPFDTRIERVKHDDRTVGRLVATTS
ncbi:CapA family protein [Streptomyces arenae]|uniref:CapA family protein n=1 Tax=Streptomyces arenae TaxID=29301 RepID=UPI00265A9646|nr:CapA family protein [Streptomyces arenae]MCG7205126.1 CapA family protein [Streptomyces arenae]